MVVEGQPSKTVFKMDQTPLAFQQLSEQEMQSRATCLWELLSSRRTIRDFSDRPIPEGVLERCLEIAHTAPSGANLQPWHFSVIKNPQIKKEIRDAAQAEERAFYQSRASAQWLETLKPLGTDAHKPFLETAPALIAIFQKATQKTPDNKTSQTYYPKESTGIATGFLIASLHQVGLACLTHTPSPMGFLNKILGRPASEKPFLLLVVGFPAENCQVPHIHRRDLEELCDFFE
jgi:nitroreductase